MWNFNVKVKRFIKYMFFLTGYTISLTKERHTNKILNALNIDLVIDVGANEGQFARSLRYEGYAGSIISFEPTSQAYNALLKNVNLDENWSAFRRCALGPSVCQIAINVSDNNGLSSSILSAKEELGVIAPSTKSQSSDLVEQITLDSIWDEISAGYSNIFLKLDVQGYEDAVLKGVQENFSKIKAVKIELSNINLYHLDKLYNYYFKIFEDLNFELWDLEEGFRDPKSGRLLQFDALFVRKK